MKKNYYRLAREFHPDRASESDKSAAAEKFSILHQAYAILSNPETKRAYDENQNSEILFCQTTIASKWEQHVVQISDEKIDESRKLYQGTDAELLDIKREIIIGKGSITHLLNTIPFMRIEDEPRMLQIIQSLIASKVLPSSIKIRKIRK